MAIRDELACSGDPVDLLSGSFTWNYRDLALYGKNDLEFTRYYESVHADENYGLGNGWTSNFSYSLEFDGRSVLAHLPRGTRSTSLLILMGAMASVRLYAGLAGQRLCHDG